MVPGQTLQSTLLHTSAVAPACGSSKTLIAMKQRYERFNPKRRIRSPEAGDAELLARLAKTVGYGGNPEHKKVPGDFGLTPPSDPRQCKSLCDDAAIKSHREALELLKSGITKGLISDRFNGDWPKNIWSVTADGKPLEAQLENPESGTYHGYPMPESDPFSAEILRRWSDAGV